ncbi:MAG TPA: hypothetical protein VFP84_09320 [Kofleriaceae bacterium]|nr:hypothetical protein [Kofleriaceae bacterium]
MVRTLAVGALGLLAMLGLKRRRLRALPAPAARLVEPSQYTVTARRVVGGRRGRTGARVEGT